MAKTLQLEEVPLRSSAKLELPIFKGKVTSNYLLAVHPDAWDIFETDSGWVWLPLIVPMFLETGINGLKREKQKANGPILNLEGYLANHRESDGRIGLNPDIVGPYVKRIKVLQKLQNSYRPIYHHVALWEEPVQFDDGEMEIQHNEAERRKWLGSLIGRFIPYPKPKVQRDLRKRVAYALENLRRQRFPREDLIKSMAAKLDAIDATPLPAQKKAAAKPRRKRSAKPIAAEAATIETTEATDV